MPSAIQNYLVTLAERFGEGWNRFWFVPTSAATLGVLRLATGLAALYWQLTFTPDLVRFFGPQGIVPIDTVRQWRGDSALSAIGNFSYLDYLSAPGELWFAHVVGAIVLVLFAVGLFARVTAVLGLLVVLSYIHRAPMLTSEFEPILALTMFYLCLGPSGDYYSLDAILRRTRSLVTGEQTHDPLPSAAATVATRLLQVHLTAIYLMMALGKFSADTWWTGEAIWWIVARPESPGYFLSRSLSHLPYVFNAWTHAQAFFELGFAVFIWNRLARPLLLGLAAAMWTLLAVATGFYLFCLMMIVANLAFIDPAAVRNFLRRRPAAAEGEEVVVTAPPRQPARV